MPYLPPPLPRLVLFGGKGGVGKTTFAAATAVHLARAEPERQILVVSTDPAHSLGDVFDLILGSEPSLVAPFPNLRAMHLDGAKRWREWLRTRRVGIEELLSDGLELDESEAARLLGFPIPGLDEIMGLLTLEEILRRREADLVIVDTAPTGHTLRLLELPEILPSWVSAMDGLREKQRYIAARFGPGRETAADRFVRSLQADLKRIRGLLRDPRECRFVLVMRPETVVEEETERFLAQLRKRRVPVTHVIANHCDAGDDVEMGKRWPEIDFVRYPRVGRELVGVENVAEILSAEPAVLSLPDGPKGPVLVRISRDAEIVLVAGKGGVGKTTVAAAIALGLEGNRLLYSTDPAHSLADVLGLPVGPEPTEVEGLRAQQVDPLGVLEELKRVPREEVEALADRESSFDLPFERKTLARLLDLVPPGLDEAMALARLTEERTRRSYDRIVIDTAPTGHLLRLLETPELAARWLGFALNLLMERGILPKTSRRLVEWTAKLESIARALRSPERCHAIVVTTDERVVLAETERLAAALRLRGIPLRTLVWNRLSAPPTRPAWASGLDEVELPLHAPPPRGCERLRRLLVVEREEEREERKGGDG